MLKTAKYRVYPNTTQERVLRERCCLYNEMYNAALLERRYAYQTYKFIDNKKANLTFYAQCKSLTELRNSDKTFADVPLRELRGALKEVDSNYKAFFESLKQKKVKGKVAKHLELPRPKPVNEPRALKYADKNGWKLLPNSNGRHGRLYVMHIGTMRLRGKPGFTGEAKAMDITYKNGKWYASININVDTLKPHGQNEFGIDWGIRQFVTIIDTNNNVHTVNSPRFRDDLESRISALNQALATKVKGSVRFIRTKQHLQALHERIARRRQDFIHKATRQLINKASLIATEELSVDTMLATETSLGKYQRKATSDLSPAMFFTTLQYKAREAGVKWVAVPTRKVKPSRTCSQCGYKKAEGFSEVLFKCEQCGTAINRDINAARNMLAYAQQQ